mgnify:FL=1
MNIPECCTHCKTMQKHNCIFQESCVTVRRFLRKQYDSMMIEYSNDTHRRLKNRHRRNGNS